MKHTIQCASQPGRSKLTSLCWMPTLYPLMAQHGGCVCGLPQMCVCHIITGDKNRPVVKVLFPLHTSISKSTLAQYFDCTLTPLIPERKISKLELLNSFLIYRNIHILVEKLQKLKNPFNQTYKWSEKATQFQSEAHSYFM